MIVTDRQTYGQPDVLMCYSYL